MRSVEFYNFEKEVWYKVRGESFKLVDSSKEVIEFILDKVEEFYPEAYAALSEICKSSKNNLPYFRYRVVLRFCKCNFGNIDHVSDISENGELKLEHVQCPLRGICPHEEVICHPKFNSSISKSEMNVLQLVFQRKQPSEIAVMLNLSPHTVNNHIRNAYSRIGVKSKAEFVDYAHNNNLFKNN